MPILVCADEIGSVRALNPIVEQFCRIKTKCYLLKLNKNWSLREGRFLNVIDNNIAYVKNNDTEMYAEKINFDKNTSIIELIDSVTIIRNEEKITGDYGTLDTINNSYKIKSKNQTKVRVIIQNNE